MTVKDFSVGKPAYLLRCNGYDRYPDPPREVEVAKVGRKLVYVKTSSWGMTSFVAPLCPDVRPYFEQNIDYGEKDLLFPTIEAYNEWIEQKELSRWFRENFHKIESLNADRLRLAKQVLVSDDWHDPKRAAEWKGLR